MNSIQVVSPSESSAKQTEGRILALQMQGAGAKSPILIVNVYQAVSKNENKKIINQVLQAVMELRNGATGQQVPTIAVGDWNATTSPSQRFCYKGDGWAKG